jgi:hypothetical protein
MHPTHVDLTSNYFSSGGAFSELFKKFSLVTEPGVFLSLSQGSVTGRCSE